ncbi:MAG TPA: tRNA (adenosine(37)-N6)-threonylcarbamoyltransferase complex transferase subunit TsaD [Verrucomicrobia bacterium]|nr:tRNA (adenosine(37)-N6)-threonylcarbamoyltransferase complex transferase subunit TsaD [Verrucomicrobiota bacterium]HOP96668.1 tRNA (adenosine(37)-N6)-threonylcarbamoyltransferase complex transferase subunit TsaD [Verrucomicrobiota bacterium]HPU55357.1 tRNA (adenosine(37)-N6)-threonylcarbamoyltransferase complex transferase subunit TsaD [Verrucomicrobiota bacterium]
MLLLAIETSCDETSAAVIRDGCALSNVVSSQIRLHAEYGGVVPELAAREHLRNLTPVTQTALREARVEPEQLDAVAATRGPGLPGALMIGFKAAQGIAFALNRPFIGVHHHEAHLYSPWISGNPPASDFESFESNVSLIVSGGHTMLVHVENLSRHRLLGSTLDDAAGECFDKVGKLLGLPYPAGPEIDRLAEQGNAKAFDFPRPMIHEPNDDFSFSGLKTSVRYFLRDNPGLANDAGSLRDLCASVQSAIVDVLVAKTVKAAERLGVRCVTASGGVTCNRALRRALANECEEAGLRLRLAAGSLCTDNAAMIGILAEHRLSTGTPRTHGSEEILPNWSLEEVA